ncbi:hypothetical protein FOA52_005641 [Chlamydomonas sp. UWO 241]|nr:hypothetical protein FOA52_005641 [Chlamydomonas sp. UWO 241]
MRAACGVRTAAPRARALPCVQPRAFGAGPCRRAVSPASRPHGAAAARRNLVCAAVPDGNVKEAPQKSPAPGSVSSKAKSPVYKVMLHNDPVNKREYVTRVLIKVIDNFSVTDALRVMTEAHENGVSVVVTCPQPDAESYCEGLRGNGLNASILPG